MIKISVDEGAAFDMLSIMEVKNKVRNTSIDANCVKLWFEIAEQISEKKMIEIKKSEEYKELLKDNEQVFKLVELAQKDNGLAKMIDVGNHKRYISKSKLQEKFFKTKITELKIGY